ncbi:MAG: hypothetical protein QOE70_1749 [Chthoniobacter sp.]|jgi:hypothetical protein|nr:hypothetical protein [Chthoniobacter sp.]
MKTFALTRLAAVLVIAVTFAHGQEAPQMPKPTKEHEWLQQFAGEWEYEVEISMEPGKPPMKAKGTEVARLLGGFWVVGEGKGAIGEMPFTTITTFGYDPAKKKYIGTGIDSMTSTLWNYEGSVDAAGKTLTLETEGPCPMRGGQLSRFREVIEFKSKDHRVFTSSILGDDGKWTTLVSVNSLRKK